MINLRDDAPDQLNTIDPTELSEQIEKLNSINAQISSTEASLKQLKEQEKQLNNFTIPELMEKMNLSTLKLKDGSELSVKKIYSATIKASYQSFFKSNFSVPVYSLISLISFSSSLISCCNSS